jgi:hypothetical protein
MTTTTDEPLAALADLRDPATTPVTFRTGLLRTRVEPHGPDGFRWVREPGSLAPEPFQRNPSLHGAAHPVLCLGTPDGDARAYLTGGDTSAATRLLREGDGAVGSLTEVLRQVGQALRALHGTPLDATGTTSGEAAVPRGLRRYDRWVAGRAGTPAAASALGVVHGELGPERLRRLASWRTDLASEPVVLSHGAPGLGSVVLGPGGRVDLLTGEDLGPAPRSFDTGWLLGELVELRLARGGDAAAWNDLTEALADGTGQDLGSRWNLAAAFRILLHLHDYTAYVTWDEALIRHYARFVAFLLDVATEASDD